MNIQALKIKFKNKFTKIIEENQEKIILER